MCVFFVTNVASEKAVAISNLSEEIAHFSPPAYVLKLWQRQQLVPPSATPPREAPVWSDTKCQLVQKIILDV